ncbi:MAG: Slp family lipoprotein [Gammaproteobacteria bacterium]
MKPARLLFFSVLVFLLNACATGPKFKADNVDLAVTPQSVITEYPTISEKSALWGGVIISTRNLQNRTQIEVLAYPLDKIQMPKRKLEPVGRFIAEYYGFLEPTIYSKDRLITVVGKVSRTMKGKIGEIDYKYPVLDINNLHLWEPNSEESLLSKLRFGIGVGIRL